MVGLRRVRVNTRQVAKYEVILRAADAGELIEELCQLLKKWEQLSALPPGEHNFDPSA